MELVIRPLILNDLTPVYDWIEANPLFAKYGMNREKLHPFLSKAISDPESAVIGAYDVHEDALRGFAWFMKKGAFGRSGYLRLIAVDPEAKNSGIGRALMNNLEANFLTPNGLFLLATHTNIEAHQFYTRLGYRRVGEILDYVMPGLDEIIFYKAP